MLRSLRARLLIASMTIAVCAVAATAWLTSRDTTKQLEGDLQRTLEADGYIYDELHTFSTEHSSWDGVDELVDNLAEETGRRIALTTMRGDVLADSARGDGGDADLPRNPAALVDPLAPSIIYGAELDDELSSEDVAALNEVEDALAAFLDERGVEYTVETDRDGVRWVEVDWDDDAVIEVLDEFYDELYPGGVEISTPSDRDLFDERTEAEAECLTRRQVPFTRVEDSDGFVYLEPDDADRETEDLAYLCAEEAARSTTSPRAQLYLGSGDDQRMTLMDAGGDRTLLAAGIVAAIAVALSIAASRRVLRPVAALTDAARRMESGDLDRRVDDDGKDEIAQLARAFNSMAGALATDEERRRRMASDVAHELRTPLANIRGYVEAAQDGVTPSDPAFLSSLHEEAVLLQRLVDDLQVLSLAEAGRLTLHREPVDLNNLVDQTATAHRLQAEASEVSLMADVPSVGTVLDVDPVRLRQALGNLVSNAIRHTPPEGKVTIRAWTEGTDALVEVADTGEGIAPDHLPHIFDRFWRADASRTRDTGGSGLGLAICQQLVEYHGGEITATSTVGKGSVFRVRLPLG